MHEPSPAERKSMSQPRTPPSSRLSSWSQALYTYARYSQLGWTLAAAVVLGTLGGWWADTRLGTSPWLVLLGACLGIGTGLYLVLATVLRRR
jgi:F0F1-type ATP synthase assembly protein I